MNCDKCKYMRPPHIIGEERYCEKFHSPMHESVHGCESGEPRFISNADRIRAMSDEELALAMRGCPDGVDEKKCINIECSVCWLDWLKSKAEVE